MTTWAPTRLNDVRRLASAEETDRRRICLSEDVHEIGSSADFGVSAVVIHELYYGAFKSHRVEKNVARVDGLQFPVLEFDEEDARQAGEIRAHLASKGTPVGPYDVLIAGQARARKLTLVTHNTTEFQRVAGLRVEDWKGAKSPKTL